MLNIFIQMYIVGCQGLPRIGKELLLPMQTKSKRNPRKKSPSMQLSWKKW